jgi:hypothetical protein
VSVHQIWRQQTCLRTVQIEAKNLHNRKRGLWHQDWKQSVGKWKLTLNSCASSLLLVSYNSNSIFCSQDNSQDGTVSGIGMLWE